MENRVTHTRYLIAHACFSCRVSFKLPPEQKHSCPNCGGSLHEMGRSFKAPKKDDAEQWLKVQTLYALGFRFFGSGRYEGERLPKRLRDVEDFVTRNPEHYLRIARVEPSLLPAK